MPSMRVASLVLCLLATCAQAFVLPAAQPAAVARSCSVSLPAVTMTSLDKKEKAKHIKAKSSRAATKRFKATATGKLLRRRPFKQHILTKKHPLRKQKLNKCAAPRLRRSQSWLLSSSPPPRPARRPSHRLANRCLGAPVWTAG